MKIIIVVLILENPIPMYKEISGTQTSIDCLVDNSNQKKYCGKNKIWTQEKETAIKIVEKITKREK